MYLFTKSEKTLTYRSYKKWDGFDIGIQKDCDKFFQLLLIEINSINCQQD